MMDCGAEGCGFDHRLNKTQFIQHWMGTFQGQAKGVKGEAFALPFIRCNLRNGGF